MTFLPSDPRFMDSPVIGPLPGYWANVDMPDGEEVPWLRAPVGSRYVRKLADDRGCFEFLKVKNDGRDDDWSARFVLRERVVRAQFTDGGGTSGFVDLGVVIPAGAWVQQAFYRNVVGFTGNVSAVATLGDGTTGNRYMTGSPSVFGNALIVDPGVPSGTKAHATQATPRLTVTGNSSFAAITAGAMTVEIVGMW